MQMRCIWGGSLRQRHDRDDYDLCNKNENLECNDHKVTGENDNANKYYP